MIQDRSEQNGVDCKNMIHERRNSIVNGNVFMEAGKEISSEPHPRLTTGNIPDEAFQRGAVPLTKEEIRAVALSKLRLTADAVCYDIGAGTGA